MQSATSHAISLLGFLLFFVVATAFSCGKEEFDGLDLKPELSTLDTVAVIVDLASDPKQKSEDLDGMLSFVSFAELGYQHQSAAVYGDYLFLVSGGRGEIRLFDMARRSPLFTLTLKRESNRTYHCNQSTFGIEKYNPEDYFPLLYISQRSRMEKRCFTEVFRIIPLFNEDSTTFLAFRAELVQEIFFPPMSKENSLGNVNCVIDSKAGKMYTYSRNNNSKDANYTQCKISCFAIPDIHQQEIFLEDSDIESAFMIDTKATNMQGGCIVNGRLYIGQGYPSAKYVYLNVVDLQKKRLVKRYDLLAKGIDWEPEGCFFYDGNVMLSYTDAISRIIEVE